MASSSALAAAVSAAVTLLAAVLTGGAGFFMWMIAMNGFMGQQRAVDASMYTYVGLAVFFGVVCAILSGLAAWYLAGKRGWHAAGSAVLCIAVFATASGALHAGSVLISAIVGDQMRTNR